MKTIMVHSIHRGEGKTKIAKELAGYTQMQGNQVLLADLDFITDPHSRALGLPSSPNLEDLLKDIAEEAKNNPYFAIHFSEDRLSKYLLTHNTGLKVLSSENAKYLADDEEIAQKIRTVVRNLKQLPYDMLIIDTDSSNRDYNQVILDEADHVLIVMDNFRYNVKDLILYLHKLQDMDYSTENFKIVLNKVPDPVQVTIEEIEKESGLPVIGIVPVLDKTYQPSADTENVYLNVADPNNVDFINAIKKILDVL
ncbi:CobQ/CobB/MinD/ParA nucleotide binding domain-containing protein [Desulforamulus putei DSM 12395]|uniref:CobQ/CobB/MinD/ParA nucleotide binding domain-containing protein n=1 Tax=Desulforamulus putei DSM 12395 TaxID=1121429 RepID=A0A1M4T9Q6_9FIRM|nr:AAA family ATPase [Desulforamulus putei]SHE41282.1 CobQ/CobB/MinD/ParA nucleotide binding domain-containing protein [Desulforamulus putei DSM 12395]